MATNYKIFNIANSQIESGKSYLIDSNVWLIILKNNHVLGSHEQNCLDFFEKIISSDDCKIVIHSLLVSEVYNAFMRYCFDLYKAQLLKDPKRVKSESEIKSLQFKSDYRATEDHDRNLQRFKSDFKAYENKFLILDYSKVDTLYVTNNLPSNTDFNDYFYYELSLEHDLIIVTNDGDFIFQGVTILTANHKLLRNVGATI